MKLTIATGEFSCCGGYGYTLGYQDWKHTVMGGARNSVPDSCCLQEAPSCGKNIFAITDLRVVIQKIHTHGCLTTMLRRLETHVNVKKYFFKKIRESYNTLLYNNPGDPAGVRGGGRLPCGN